MSERSPNELRACGVRLTEVLCAWFGYNIRRFLAFSAFGQRPTHDASWVLNRGQFGWAYRRVNISISNRHRFRTRQKHTHIAQRYMFCAWPSFVEKCKTHFSIDFDIVLWCAHFSTLNVCWYAKIIITINQVNASVASAFGSDVSKRHTLFGTDVYRNRQSVSVSDPAEPKKNRYANPSSSYSIGQVATTIFKCKLNAMQQRLAIHETDIRTHLPPPLHISYSIKPPTYCAAEFRDCRRMHSALSAMYSRGYWVCGCPQVRSPIHDSRLHLNRACAADRYLEYNLCRLAREHRRDAPRLYHARSSRDIHIHIVIQVCVVWGARKTTKETEKIDCDCVLSYSANATVCHDDGIDEWLKIVYFVFSYIYINKNYHSKVKLYFYNLKEENCVSTRT